MTRGEAAEARYSGMTYDCALPQSWVDYCYALGRDPRGHFVWLYDEAAGLCGRPAPITPDGDEMLLSLSKKS